MRLFNRILNLFRGRKTPKPVPAGPVQKEEYERWLGIWTVPFRSWTYQSVFLRSQVLVKFISKLTPPFLLFEVFLSQS